MLNSCEAKNFLHFIRTDAQLKAFGQCCQQVDLLALDANDRPFDQRPDRTALVVVRTFIFINFSIYLFFYYQDGECCLDRFYGGYFPDWSCGGQWQNMMSFLSALLGACHEANVHMAIFYNGATEADRFPAWVQTQMKYKHHVNQVMKHLQKRMTPPPKAFWVPPSGLTTMLRLAIKSLHGTVHNSLEDHHLEIMSYCFENGYHGVMTDNGEFAFFNPPRLFSAHDLKLSFSQELETTEWVIGNVQLFVHLTFSFCTLGGASKLFVYKQSSLHSQFAKNLISVDFQIQFSTNVARFARINLIF